MRKLLVPLLFLLLLVTTGCKTTEVEYVYPALPEFSIELPQKETLDSIPENATSEDILNIMILNTIKLNSYISQLEIYNRSLLTFYNNIRITYNKDNRNE